MRERMMIRPALFVALAVPLTLAACDPGPTGVVTDGEPITVERGVSFQITDTAVVVNGATRRRLPSAAVGLSIYHAISYEYGGLGSYQPDRVWSEQWFSRLSYELEPVERGDTVVFEFLDFGDIVMDAADTLLKATDTPTVGPNPPYPLEWVNFVVYLGTHYAWRRELSGTEILFVESPYLPRLAAGATIGLAGTGSDQVAPFDAGFSIAPLPALTGLESGGPIAFRTERPVIDAGQDLVLAFDAPIDAESAIFAMFPWPEDVADPTARRNATIVGGLETPSDRAIIPAATLGGMLDAAGADDVGYLLYVIRLPDSGQAIDARRLDTDEDIALPVGQWNEIRFFVRLTR